MLHIHSSNRPERLADALVKLLRAAPQPLFTSETILVPSTAVARWLNFCLADGLGIVAQIRHAFPAAYVWQLFGRVLPDVAAKSPFEREAMQWHLLRLLGENRAPEIRRYLENDDGTRQYELARQLATLFDRYLVERPDWIAAWSEGRRIGLGHDEDWQAQLWQSLLTALPPVAAEHPRKRFLASLEGEPALRERLPRRLSLFCVEAMPDLYWQVFSTLARWIEVHLFVLTPCREYWGDLERPRKRLRIEIERPEAATLFEEGHPLVASLGRARQYAFSRLIDSAAQLPCREEEDFVLPPATLLGALQRDILDLTSSPTQPDITLQIHACHGAQREAEVLHDRLLELFEKLPDLQSADILILTPDIETYGPIIAAVLDHAPAARRLPCTVADRPLAAMPLWRALQLLCRVAAAELDAESVLRLLEESSLRRAFEIELDELPRLRDWVAEAGIRWGVDGAARARRGLPEDDAFTWRAGLRRLLLGVAMPDAPECLWQDALPVAGIEGEDALLLGRFVRFVETLFDLQPKLGAHRTAPAWSALLLETFERCLAPEEAEETQAQRLREALRRIGEEALAARSTLRLPLAVMLRELDSLLAEQAPPQAFLAGSVTIAALRPGRPVAARVICLVGLNDGCWPRPRTVPAFDLLAQHPHKGDRNLRGEERYALLETLLCASDAVVITYTGCDPRSNLPLPPAPPLAELIDVIAKMTREKREKVVVEHPLQPFASVYFTAEDERLFSFDAEHCPSGVPIAPRPFYVAGKPLPVEEPIEVDLATLQRFFSHPVRYFLRERLGIHLEEREALLEVHEPFVPDGLESYRLREAEFEALRLGLSETETRRLLSARGWLPSGIAGELAARAAREESIALWREAQPWLAGEPVPAQGIEHSAGGVHLGDRLEDLTSGGLLRVRHGQLRAKDRLRLWIDHLLLNACAPGWIARKSVLVARDGVLRLPEVADAKALLDELFRCYRIGLTRPLSFYPETAWAWLTGKNWQKVWQGDDRQPGECDDPYLRLFLRDREGAVDEEFQRLAEAIFRPLWETMKLGDG